jgi:predicted ATPase
MLTIERLIVKNFRSIDELEIDLLPLAILIGKNNVGKSNVLDAVEMLLDGTPRSVTANEFFDTGKPFEIRAILSGVREYLPLCEQKHRTRIEERVTVENKLTIRRESRGTGELEKIQILNPADDSFTTPTGIDAGLRSLLPEVIYIRALADVADETGKSSGALPKILGQISANIEAQAMPAIESAFTGAQKLLNVVIEGDKEVDERVQELRNVEQEISNYLQETFQTASARLKTRGEPLPLITAKGMDFKEFYISAWLGHWRAKFGSEQGEPCTVHSSFFLRILNFSSTPRLRSKCGPHSNRFQGVSR